MDDIKKLFSRIISEDSIAPAVYSVYVQTFEPGFEMRNSHSHNAVEVISVLHGSAYMAVNDNCFKIKKNECLIIFPEINHRFFLDDNECCRLMNVHFTIGDIDNFLNTTDMQEPLRFLYEIKTHSMSFLRLVDNDIIRNISERIISEVEGKRKFSEMLLRLYFCEMYIELSRIISENCNMFLKPLNSHVRCTLEYINSFYNDRITIDQIAKHVGLSSRHLSRLFFDALGMTLPDYINMLRIKKAKDLLQNTNMDITDIAMTLGFNTSQYFSTCFKKYENTTPKKYREIINGCILNKN